MNERVKGYLCVAASAVLYGLNPIAAKYAYAGGANPLNLLLLRGAAVVPLFVYALIRGEDMSPPRGKQARDIGILGLAGMFLTPLFLFLSYTYIPSGAATSLHYVYCVLTLIVCVVFYREKFDSIKAACVALCVLGVFMIYAPDGMDSALGVALALASAVTFAAYTVYLDKSGLHRLSPVKLQVFCQCVALPFSFAYAAATGALSFKMSAPAWGAALGYFMFGACIAGLLFQRGVHYIGAQRSAILSTLEPLTSAVLGVALFYENITWRAALGMAAILAAAVLITAADGLRERRTRAEAPR